MPRWLNNNSAVGTVVALLLLIVAGLIASRALGGRSYKVPTVQVYYYDLDTGELFAADNQASPITAPSGGEGVSATVYGCGGCDDSKALQVAYLTTIKPAADETADPLTLVSGDRGATWVPYESPQGFALTDDPLILTRCATGEKPVFCQPRPMP